MVEQKAGGSSDEESEEEMKAEFILGHHFELAGFNKLPMVMERNDKYLFVHDAYGQCDIFFNYSPHIICNVAKEMIKVNLGKAIRADVCEIIRSYMVKAMREGMFLILNLD